MKKIVDLSIGRMSFSLEDDAYDKLERYLQSFENSIKDENERVEVMQDVETRIAEIFLKEQNFKDEVITVRVVNIVIDILGEVEDADDEYVETNTSETYTLGEKKIYRDPNNKMLGGLCSGLSVYLKIDPTIVRLIFALLAVCYGSSIIVYIVCWIVIPEALTISQQLELRGYATTAENIRKFKSENKNA